MPASVLLMAKNGNDFLDERVERFLDKCGLLTNNTYQWLADDKTLKSGSVTIASQDLTSKEMKARLIDVCGADIKVNVTKTAWHPELHYVSFRVAFDENDVLRVVEDTDATAN